MTRFIAIAALVSIVAPADAQDDPKPPKPEVFVRLGPLDEATAIPDAPAQPPVEGTVTTKAPGGGVMVDGVTSEYLEFDVSADHDNATMEGVATPAAPADLDLYLERRPERRGDRRAQNDEIADADGMQELQSINGRGHERPARVAVRRDGARDVDQVHHRPAEDESERVRVVRQDDLHHLGEGVRRPLRRRRHQKS